jgi:uncharacterized membrane protein
VPQHTILEDIAMDFFDRLITALTELHPIHSMTVHFPLALTGTALLFLVLALWRRNESLEQASFLNMTLAAISTVVAGFTGYRDYLVRFEGDAPYTSAKIFLAITLFLLTSATVISRWRKADIVWQPSTTVLYVSAFIGSFAIASVLGFLGGAILYGF